MGLSSYGKSEFLNEMEELINYNGDGEYKLNLKYYKHHKEKIDFNFEEGSPDIGDIFTDEIYNLLGKHRDYKEEITQRHKNIAKSMQTHTENIIFKMLDYAYNETKIDKLSFAGGVAMNSVANGKIIRKTNFKDVYIPPAAGDAGTSMGAAFYVYNIMLNNTDRFHLNNGYLGPSYTEEEIKKSIDDFIDEFNNNNMKVHYYNDENELIENAVKDIENGLVLGWYQGRMEFGARALGNRSIVVDPRRKDMRDILNSRIKKRESFRPFAPSILFEKTSDWFEESYPVPFMEKVYNIKEEKRELIPAVTHVDGTGRLQTVDESQNPLYYKLIKKFEEKTGVPIVLNTSFNENEPIVNTPKEAINTFLRTKMDTLIIGNYILKR
jgi:carbamoyltransferase